MQIISIKMVFHVHVLGMNQDETCTDMCIKCTAKSMPCIYHVQTRIYNTEYMYFIHTMFRPCIYTSKQAFVYMFVYIFVQTMYIPCTYMACKISRCFEQEIQKGIFFVGPDSNPRSCAYKGASLTTTLPACLCDSQ
jgi:hypothetical protein